MGVATVLLAVGSGFRIRTRVQTSRTALAPTQPLTEWTSSSFLGGDVVGDENSTIHLHLARSLRLGGALPPICPGGGIFICLKLYIYYIISYIVGERVLHGIVLRKECMELCLRFICVYKGKSVPLQTRRGPEGSRKLRFPDFVTTAQDGGKVVSLTHRPPLPPGNIPVTNFC